MRIITHRGLDPSRPLYFPESSREAFEDQLSRGYGLEFDLQFTADERIIILHDSNLARATEGEDRRQVADVSSKELVDLGLNGGHLISFPELLSLIQDGQSQDSISAIHVKASIQNDRNLEIILGYLKDIDTDKFMLFDLIPESARYMKGQNSNLHLACSVAHPHDRKRYNASVGGTLLSIEEAIANKELFDWVWLDEWDLSDLGDKQKTFYTSETFSRLREAGFKIALVTPELHGTSPGLLGGEAHPDAQNMSVLTKRLKEIVALNPDAVCTDYPDLISDSISNR